MSFHLVVFLKASKSNLHKKTFGLRGKCGSSIAILTQSSVFSTFFSHFTCGFWLYCKIIHFALSTHKIRQDKHTYTHTNMYQNIYEILQSLNTILLFNDPIVLHVYMFINHAASVCSFLSIFFSAHKNPMNWLENGVFQF